MLALHMLASAATATNAAVWGETVRDSARQLEVIAVSGAKDHFIKSVDPDGKPLLPLAHPRPNGGGRVLRDKGLLMASLSASTDQNGLTLKESHPAANLHDKGGTIRPKSAKRLAIPITREAKRAGSPRNNFPRPLFIVGANTGTGTLYLGESTGKGKRAKLVIHYVLVRQVTIPQRRTVGFSRETIDKMVRVLFDRFEKNLVADLQKTYAANPIIQG